MRNDVAAWSATVTGFLEASCGLAGPWRVEPIATPSKGHRVFRLVGAQGSVVGKRYRGDGVQHSEKVMRGLAGRPFRYLSVPKVLGVHDATRTLLMAEAVGEPCAEPPYPTMDGFRRIGRALRELHESPLFSERARRLEDHVAELIRPHPRELARNQTRFERIVENALAALEESSEAADQPTVTLHRDFHLRQLFDNGDRVSIVDWDVAARGEAAFDLAYFSTYLSNHLPRETAARGRQAFLNGYAPDASTLSRIPIYETFNYLRRACRRFRLKDAGWQPEMERMLGLLEQGLERV